jgi:DNA-binding MarR family transcriptional regulator
MNSKNLIFRELTEQFIRILNKAAERQKIPRDYGTGELIHQSEIHTIEAIGNNPGIHMSELAKILGVTRGAVQQMSEKLISKGFILRYQEPHDNKKVFLKLTKKGQIAYAGHEKSHEKMNADILTQMQDFTIEDIAKFKAVFNAIEKNLETPVKDEQVDDNNK